MKRRGCNATHNVPNFLYFSPSTFGIIEFFDETKAKPYCYKSSAKIKKKLKSIAYTNFLVWYLTRVDVAPMVFFSKWFPVKIDRENDKRKMAYVEKSSISFTISIES